MGDNPDAADRVLTSAPLRVGLVAWALRLPCDQPEHVRRTALQACSFLGELLHAGTCTPAAAAGQLELVQGLLRTQALHASARQLASATEGLERAPQPPSVGRRRLALNCLQSATALFSRLAYADAAPSLLSDLAAHLAESAALEHAARLLLALLRCEPPPSAGGGQALGGAGYKIATWYMMCSVRLYDTVPASEAAQAASPGGAASGAAAPPSDAAAVAVTADRLRQVLSGPCAHHAAMVLGLAALCQLEGGAAGVGAAGGGGGAGEEPCPCVARAVQLPVEGLGLLMVLLEALRPRHPAASFKRLTAARVALRVGFAAAAAGGQQGTEQAAGGAGGSSGPNAPAHRPALSPDEVPELSVLAFSHVFTSMRSLRPWLGPRAAPAADMWRLAAAMAEQGVLGERATDRHRNSYTSTAAGLLVYCWEDLKTSEPGEDTWHFPAEPPPAVSAALAGGALPLLERLLRRAGEEPEEWEAAVAAGLNDSMYWSCLLPLLAYGEPLQAAALVASATKLLRRADPHGLLGPKLLGAGLGAALAADVCCAFAEGIAGPPTAAADAPAALSRLGLVLSLALPEWLPELSRLVRRAAALDEAAWRAEQREPGQRERAGARASEAAAEGPKGLLSCMEGLLVGLGWRPLGTPPPSSPGAPAGGANASTSAVPGSYEMPATAAGSGSAKAAGGDAAVVEAGGTEAGGGEAGGGRRGFVPAAEAVEVVGAALGLVQRRGPDPRRWLQLYADLGSAALVLAAECPEQVRRASGGAISAFPWRPEGLRAVAAALRGEGSEGEGQEEGEGGHGALAVEVERLARQLEAGAEGEVDGGFAVGVPKDPCDSRCLGAALSGLVVPPAEARRRLGLPACSNPACANLAGDSEAGLRLRQCGRCGQASYCCAECQRAHWRAGHKEACSGGSGGGSKAG
ncbi:hypothetical protein HYH03_009166 [Edaphochlamys debaryana]|uniref:phytol kinase n=1 Tax=Edaphochlamys debaryana TaxID=47281 RepID=A0A835Y1S2_9CHLO|nr:hypothetical protein HYH03_009166 [Edaphochlamys debaryana]|eukprot:KAG2492501.1 hypothetical protein HYH03_009166 [Edaphochlamys debaryana]